MKRGMHPTRWAVHATLCVGTVGNGVWGTAFGGLLRPHVPPRCNQWKLSMSALRLAVNRRTEMASRMMPKNLRSR